VSGYEPPDDPSEAPTGFYDYSGEEQGSPQRSTWYRNPIVLVALGLFVAILLGLAFYLLADQTKGTGGTTQTPTSPTTVAPTTTTGDTTTTEPVAPPENTATTVPPTTTGPDTGTAPTTTTSVDEGHHHHHHHASRTR
jgi:hypothetical protein